MKSDFMFLGESKTTIAIACPKCKHVKAIDKNLLLGSSVLKENHLCSCGFKSSSVHLGYLHEKKVKCEKIKPRILLSGLMILIIGVILASTLPEYNSEIQAWFGIIFIISGLIMLFIQSQIGNNINELETYGQTALSSHIEEENEKAYLKCVAALDEKVKQYGIPDNRKLVTISNKTKGFPGGKCYMWLNDSSVNFFPKIELTKIYPDEMLKRINNLTKIQIHIDKIEYYYTQGEVYRENKISGGGGGGSSIGGAVVGGVIAGGAGAIIGSRKQIPEIKSELVTYDTRESYINFFANDGTRNKIFMDYLDYQTLKDLIPQKDYIVVSAIRTTLLVQSEQNKEMTKSIIDQIRELAKLKNDGILSEEEFIEKKRALLENIG